MTTDRVVKSVSVLTLRPVAVVGSRYARYVGRVGALAVALGIGVATASSLGLGVARADESGGASPRRLQAMLHRIRRGRARPRLPRRKFLVVRSLRIRAG